MGARPATVVKVGGSLAADAARLRTILAGLADGTEGPAVIVPGGGAFADAVRATQGALGFSDALAHRLALDAMGRMAEVFCEIEPRLTMFHDPDVPTGSGTPVWDPIGLRGGHPAIPESWDVTSDSLALWLATRIGAARCIVMKSAPCPSGADPAALARLGLVDQAFPEFAHGYAGDIHVRGPDEHTVLVRPAGNPSSRPNPHRRPHREVPAKAGLEGALQGSRRHLEASFEARLRLAPQDKGECRIGARSSRSGVGGTAA